MSAGNQLSTTNWAPFHVTAKMMNFSIDDSTIEAPIVDIVIFCIPLIFFSLDYYDGPGARIGGLHFLFAVFTFSHV